MVGTTLHGDSISAAPVGGLSEAFIAKGFDMRKISAAIIAVVALLAFPGFASADYYVSKGTAQRYTKDAVSNYYEDTAYSDVIASCRPQGQAKADSHYIYHRWSCAFAIDGDENQFCDDPANELYGGRFLIVGHSGSGHYGFKVLNGLHCF
jgi:hypothetical protein